MEFFSGGKSILVIIIITENKYLFNRINEVLRKWWLSAFSDTFTKKWG